ncbi:D-sedoheptulose 7-phosphate isomerase [Sulfurospirillum sp. T05]|uniref:Phosphoheptose isomerase n=1 Tax=Sulfurospirillum tamanense TaxID=2813362 RepID=A0ABS2WSR7_9BACT|nr:D-sedoheptulose 7-phosphate isomerase [Sulfurospirillum tamanensis]MBN2964648.1 D-sedoheptulose 7-phosphate isomerase [Sulfurospirillum tamanensis]
MKTMIAREMAAHQATLEATMHSMQDAIEAAAIMMVEALEQGHKVLFFGNGGSAADAQHWAAELSGRYKVERGGLAGIALTTDTSALTAIGNDYGFEFIFSRQVEALGRKGDVLVGISTSGNSPNVLRAFEKGKSLGCKSIGFSGRGGGVMAPLCDVNLIVPSNDTPRIQEMHGLIGHILCQAVDDAYAPKG